MIVDANDMTPGTWAPERAAEYAPMVAWSAPDPFNPDAPVSGRPIEARVNHGRWIVECECGGAQRTAESDPRFMCCDCGNVADGGAWRPVTWPKDSAGIADALDVPERSVQLANWEPGETVADLEEQNAVLAADLAPVDPPVGLGSVLAEEGLA